MRNDALGFVQDGIHVGYLQVFEEPMCGTETAALWPGRAWIGGPGLLGNLDEFRVWSVARTPDQIREGMHKLVQVNAYNLVCNFRFDDGRRSLDKVTEVPDGWGANAGQGAEDFAHRLSPASLETAWPYALRGITFDYVNAWGEAANEYDDADGDLLPDWWESLRFVAECIFYTESGGRSVENRTWLRGWDTASFAATYLGWTVNFTPIETAPGRRWTQPPDAAWLFKDFYLTESLDDTDDIELRMALEPGAASVVYINGVLLDLNAPGIEPAWNTFTPPGNIVGGVWTPVGVQTYYVPDNVLRPFLVGGRNRISIQMINRDDGFEYFNAELLVNGSQYVIQRGDDPGIPSGALARWFEYSHPASLAQPPPDFKGRIWFDRDYALDTDMDLDSDGLSNYEEYLVGGNPLMSDSDGNGVADGEEDFDGDGLANADELWIFGTDPRNADTDDDGYRDGAELDRTQPAVTDAFGVSAGITGPIDSHSPMVPRSLILGGNAFEAPDADRFRFLTDAVVNAGPEVTITAPADGAQIAVRFTDITGSVVSAIPISSTRLYVNGDFVVSLTLDALNQFNYTSIIRSGVNEITVVAVDQEGGVGRATVSITGTFARADIRVTQTWDRPGDLDTWLIDPLGRNMGFAAGANLVIGPPGQPGTPIPGAFLDIDDIPGVGPENITLEEPNAIAGIYQAWMNNYSHSGNPQSTVRILVNEGRPGEQYVEFGPQAMPTPGMGNPAAWWDVTRISMPDGTMTPPGTPIGGEENPEDPGTGIGADVGWTVEGWVKPGDASQTGALVAYRHINGVNDIFVVGLSNNCPIVRITVNGTSMQQKTVMAGAIPSNRWTHIAAVYS